MKPFHCKRVLFLVGEGGNWSYRPYRPERMCSHRGCDPEWVERLPSAHDMEPLFEIGTRGAAFVSMFAHPRCLYYPEYVFRKNWKMRNNT